MKIFNMRFLLFLSGVTFFVLLFIFSTTMILQDITTVHGAEPSITMDWGYPVVTPTISGYPVPEPTKIDGYPAPQPTEAIGYPVPVPSDPPAPTPVQIPIIYYISDAKGGKQIGDLSSIWSFKKAIETVIEFIKIDRPNKIMRTHKIIEHTKVSEQIKYYGKATFEIR